MTDAAVIVEDLGKQYRIGATRESYRTLRDTIAGAVKNPLRRIGAVARGEASEAYTETLWALRECSFRVAQGEVLGVVGPNGAGKSTLLKILSRITRPSEGRVRIAGRVGSLLEVGTGFHPELTGRENIYLNGAVLGMPKREIDRKFDAIAEFAGVQRFLETPVKRYSSGMYVRLAFSVAAHLEPDVLLVDEVLSVGDMAFQEKSLDRMERVASSGRTVVFVSHNLAAVRALCHSCLYLDHGRVQASGPVEEILPMYMASRRSATGGVWTIKPDDPKRMQPIHIQMVRLRNASSPVPVDEPLEIEMVFVVAAGAQHIIPGFTLWDGGGTQVFSAADWNVPKLASGTYSATCTVPAFLLSGGIHSLSAHIFNSYRPGMNELPAALVDHAISFEVDPTPWIERTGHRWLRRWPGLVRPDLSWHTRVIDGELGP